MSRKKLLTASIVVLIFRVWGSSNCALAAFGKQQRQISEETKNINEPAEKSSVTGKVLHKSDVMTIPDTPYSQGMVLAVSGESFPALLKQVGIVPGSQRIQFAMSNELFSSYVSASAELKGNGSYTLQLDPGKYALCVGNLGAPPPNPEAFPVYVYGCLNVLVKTGEERFIDIFFGIGGVTYKGD
jgi:hypothetical protein